MDKEFYLEAYNYKYNAWLPIEIIDKLDDKIVKVRYYVFKTLFQENGTTVRQFVDMFETCTFWNTIRAIKK